MKNANLFTIDVTKIHEPAPKEGPYGFPVCGSSNAHARCAIFATDMRICLKLPQGLYYMSANSKGSGETALMRRLAWAFAGRLCDKYPFPIAWLNYLVTNLIRIELIGLGCDVWLRTVDNMVNDTAHSAFFLRAKLLDSENEKKYLKVNHNIDRVKLKSVFKHVQIAQIQIILRMR